MASIKEIAKRAKVSPSTVSRVLNNAEYKCSSPEVRERIRKAAIELNYVPNEAARNLKTGRVSGGQKTCYINILMTRTDSAHVDPFFDELLRVVESEIHKNNCILSKLWYRSIFSNERRCARENLSAIVSQMYEETEGKHDGLIIIGKCSVHALEQLKKRYAHIVCVNRNAMHGGVDEVVCDGEKIAAMAVEYLIQLGHTSIAYVGACENEARYRGFVKTLQEHKIELDPDYIFKTKQTEAEGYDVMKSLLELEDDRPTGIYCANDITAVGMLKCLASSRMRYYTPAVISSDDIEEAQYTFPMLTTVRLPRDEMGKFALQILLDHIHGGHKSVLKLELEGKLMIRNSCISAAESTWSDYCI